MPRWISLRSSLDSYLFPHFEMRIILGKLRTLLAQDERTYEKLLCFVPYPRRFLSRNS